MPRPRVPSPFSPVFQPAFLGYCVDHRPGAPIAEMREPERDRILARGGSASSSMNDSTAKTLAYAPSVRSAETRSGIPVIE